MKKKHAVCATKIKNFLRVLMLEKKYYCMSCQTKISKSGMDYWKPCSFQEFMEAFSSSIHEGKRKPANMFNNLRETLRKFDDEVKNKEEK